MRVPYVDLAAQHRALQDEILASVRRVLDHGQFILGPEVAALESELATRVGADHVVGVNSGTDALVLALRLAGVDRGDEVLTVSHSFVATATAIRLVGARPVFVDVDEATMLMDPGLLAEAVTPRTAAVMPVHLNGSICAMDDILAFAEGRRLPVIEDAAQALGASRDGRSAGTWGIGAFSLHPLKVLGACGDAGFITVGDAERADRLRKMRNIGLRDRDHCEIVAGNTRLDALQAAVLRVKLRHLDEWLLARRGHVDAYRSALAGRVILPPETSGSSFVIRHPERDALLAGLVDRGVDAKIHYPLAIHQQEAFLDVSHGPLPVTERVVSTMISLPVSPELTEEGRDRVIYVLDEALAEVGS